MADLIAIVGEHSVVQVTPTTAVQVQLGGRRVHSLLHLGFKEDGGVNSSHLFFTEAGKLSDLVAATVSYATGLNKGILAANQSTSVGPDKKYLSLISAGNIIMVDISPSEDLGGQH